MSTESPWGVSTPKKTNNWKEQREPWQFLVTTAIHEDLLMWAKTPGTGAGGTSHTSQIENVKISHWRMKTHGSGTALQKNQSSIWLPAQPPYSILQSSLNTVSHPIQQHSRSTAYPRSLCKPPRLTESVPPSWSGRAESMRLHQGCIWLGVTDALGYS